MDHIQIVKDGIEQLHWIVSMDHLIEEFRYECRDYRTNIYAIVGHKDLICRAKIHYVKEVLLDFIHTAELWDTVKLIVGRIEHLSFVGGLP